MTTHAVVVPSSYLILVRVCRKMSQVRAPPGVFHADPDQISWWADDDFLQMLQCPVWTPMERLNPLHFEHINGFTAHVALLHFWAHIYCQQAPVVMDILLMTPVCPGSCVCLDPAEKSLTFFSIWKTVFALNMLHFQSNIKMSFNEKSCSDFYW